MELLTMQVPPFIQESGEQSSMFLSQFIPVHPLSQVQVYDAILSYEFNQNT